MLRLQWVAPHAPEMARLYALRHEVFVLEQRVPVELERDDHDLTADHLAAWREEDGRLVGVLRMLEWEADEAVAPSLLCAVLSDGSGAVPPPQAGEGWDTSACGLTARPAGSGRVAKIGRVAVPQDMRGRGIAAAMMREALERARSQGFDEAYLHAQWDARGLYERLGFVPEGDTFDDAGILHIAMRRRL